MLIDMLPGSDRGNLLTTLRQIWTGAQNLQAASGHEGDLVAQYSRWATDAASTLNGQVSPNEIDRLIFTARYQMIMATGAFRGTPVRDLLRLEMTDRNRDFAALVQAVEAQMLRWPFDSAVYVALDTVVFIHGDKIERLNLQKMLGGTFAPIRLLIPMAVLDELDRLKEKGDDHTRWRAGYTLAFLDRRIPDPRRPSRLFPALAPSENDGVPRGEVTVEVLLDRPGHVRLPIDDDEIVDRIAAIEPLTQSKITVFTYDSGFRARGLARDLHVIKVEKNLGAEPPRPGESTRAKRRERLAKEDFGPPHSIEHGEPAGSVAESDQL